MSNMTSGLQRLRPFIAAAAIIGVSAAAPGNLSAGENPGFFAVPDFTELPPAIEVVSEKTENGVKVTEMYLAGAPFDGKQTKIYGFYCRPEKDGKYPAVLEIHGAGMWGRELSPSAGIDYAKNGFACFVMDWCGASDKRIESGWLHSEFKSSGNLAAQAADGEKKPEWKIGRIEASGLRNGVMFARRAAMFLKSRPEVDGEKLCVAGMSAGAHLTLLILGAEPSFKAAAVKYGCGFIRDIPGSFGGYFGPITMCSKEQQDTWLARFDPKHNLVNYKASVLMLSGTDDIFFAMPGVLVTHRAIPTEKRLLMFPNENHGYVGNVPIPLSWFKSVLGLAPAWPTLAAPTAKIEGDKATLSVNVTGQTKIAKVSFWVKRMPKAVWTCGMGDKKKPETIAKWIEVPAVAAGAGWTAEIPAPKADEQLVAYAMATDDGGIQASSETVELPDYPKWRGLAGYEPWEQKLKAAGFQNCELKDPKMADKVRKAGNLSGYAKGGERIADDDRNLGWFEYRLRVPRTGWYELLVPRGQDLEYFVDGTYVYNVEGDKVGSFWLNAEGAQVHTIRLQKNHWTGFPPLEDFTLKAVAPENLAGQLRVTVADKRTILRKGESLRLLVETASPRAPFTLGVTVLAGQTPVMERTVTIPNNPGVTRTEVELPCAKEGAFTVTFSLNGKPVEKKDIRPVAFNVFDTTRQSTVGGELKRKLIKEIDCAATAPDFASGETRVTKGAAGAYRESGDTGFLKHQNATDPTWFAYKVEVPEKQKLYQIEVDYPDDALRTYLVAIREAAPDAYPVVGGVDSGGEFSLSNQMLTHSLLYWARGTDLRVLLLPALDKRRAAAARIRVYQVEGELPLLETPARGGRHFANWYEEGSNFVAMYGPPDRSMAGMLTAADRWARTIRHMGGDTLWMTMVVYQFGLYPSGYNIEYTGESNADLVRAVIMSCEKYGMDFIGEFHPEARELNWPSRADAARRHRAINRNGAEEGRLYNPLWPKNQEWYLGMIGEFVDRYKDSSALKGISLRLMGWVNPGFNNFSSLDWGYDDYAIGLFEAETGRKIPAAADDAQRFRKRYDWLLANAKAEWIEWRCAKIAELYGRIAARVRQARPDLVVLSNNFLEGEELREAGIDPLKLQAIPGVVLAGSTAYGRRSGNELDAQAMRDALLDPAALKRLAAPDGRSAFLNGAGYFEATGKVVPNEVLGLPVPPRRAWMSGVVNPAGRHSLERWALQLAETDSTFLADGGNAYTVGQPVLREFLREYRALPEAAFTPVESARDPVAVWQSRKSDQSSVNSNQLPVETKNKNQITDNRSLITDNFFFYAVNRERYPVKVRITLQNAGKVERLTTKEAVALKDGTFAFELQPYELRSFSADGAAAIAAVEVEVPETERKHAQGLAAFLAALAADAKAGKLGVTLRPDELALLESRAAEAKAELAKGHLWRVRTLAEHRSLRLLYERCQRKPPQLRENGAPVPPDGAFMPEDLLTRLVKGKAELTRLDDIWPGETLLVTADSEIEFELDAPLDAMSGIEFGHVAGGSFGALELSVAGSSAGVLAGGIDGGAPRPTLARLDGAVKLRQGKTRFTLKRLNGDRTAIRFAAVSPVFTDIVTGNWKAAGPFIVCNPRGDREWHKKVDAALRQKDWRPPEVSRDFAAQFDVEDGVKRGWVNLEGVGDEVDLGRIFDRKAGSICYAVTHITSPADARVRLRYGMDYWMKIWVNGELVKDVEPHSGHPFKGQFHVDVPLKAGVNELLVKLAAGSLGSRFWMEVSDTGDLSFAQEK